MTQGNHLNSFFSSQNYWIFYNQASLDLAYTKYHIQPLHLVYEEIKVNICYVNVFVQGHILENSKLFSIL